MIETETRTVPVTRQFLRALMRDCDATCLNSTTTALDHLTKTTGKEMGLRQYFPESSIRDNYPWKGFREMAIGNESSVQTPVVSEHNRKKYAFDELALPIVDFHTHPGSEIVVPSVDDLKSLRQKSRIVVGQYPETIEIKNPYLMIISNPSSCGIFVVQYTMREGEMERLLDQYEPWTKEIAGLIDQEWFSTHAKKNKEFAYRLQKSGAVKASYIETKHSCTKQGGGISLCDIANEDIERIARKFPYEIEIVTKTVVKDQKLEGPSLGMSLQLR